MIFEKRACNGAFLRSDYWFFRSASSIRRMTASNGSRCVPSQRKLAKLLRPSRNRHTLGVLWYFCRKRNTWHDCVAENDPCELLIDHLRRFSKATLSTKTAQFTGLSTAFRVRGKVPKAAWRGGDSNDPRKLPYIITIERDRD